MKISFNRKSGNVLILCLCISTVTGIMLASYLTMVQTTYRFNNNTQAWNLAVSAAEAGIEEALELLAKTNNWTTDNWSLNTGQYVTNQWPANSEQAIKGRTLGNAFYVVGISNASAPVVVAEGFVTSDGNQYISRKVRITTSLQGMFVKAMVAKDQIDMKGNNVKTDSFDSSDPNYSTNGKYDPNKVKDGGDVATNSEMINSLNVGNANIWGHAATGPNGSIAIGPNGSIGSLAWQTNHNTGVQPGWTNNDMNVFFDDIQRPFSSAPSPVSGTVSNIVQKYVITSSGNYQLSDLKNGTLVVRSNVNAVLLVTDQIQISGNDYILIETNASLKLYMAGASASIAGKGIFNMAGNATNFFYYGTTNNTSLSLSGNASFIGAIYAPQADFTLTGGGNSVTNDFIGSSVTGTVKFGGKFNFHFDENLKKMGGYKGVVINSWREISMGG